jgi:hypothetical protein
MAYRNWSHVVSCIIWCLSWFRKLWDNRLVFGRDANADSLRMVDHGDPSKKLRH